MAALAFNKKAPVIPATAQFTFYVYAYMEDVRIDALRRNNRAKVHYAEELGWRDYLEHFRTPLPKDIW